MSGLVAVEVADDDRMTMISGNRTVPTKWLWSVCYSPGCRHTTTGVWSCVFKLDCSQQPEASANQRRIMNVFWRGLAEESCPCTCRSGFDSTLSCSWSNQSSIAHLCWGPHFHGTYLHLEHVNQGCLFGFGNCQQRVLSHSQTCDTSVFPFPVD